MAYIGRQLTQGNFIKLDDLQSQFDGSKTTFSLTAGGQTYKPGSSNALLVSLGGVIQEAGSAFTLNNDEITFSNPPTADANIFIIALGNSVSVGTPADNTVTQRQLSDNLGEYSGIGTIILSGIVSATSIKIGSAITFSQSGIDVTGVVTATSFKGDGSNLTGITNATTVTIADESSDTTCFPLFATAATGDLAPKSGTNLTFNSSSGALTATSFVGSGANLTGVASTENIRTNTNATFLQNVSVVGTSTVTGNIVPSSDSATDIGTNSVRFQNAYVDTYYGSGANLTGISADVVDDTSPQLGGELQTNGNNIRLADSDILYIGTDGDGTLYHDGSNTYLSENGTGELYVQGNTFVAIRSSDAGENMAKFIRNGASELYYDNTKVFETTSSGAKVQKSGEVITLIGSTNGDGVYLTLDGASNGDGAGGDHAQIGHDSSGNLHIKTDSPASNVSIVFSTNATQRTIIDESGHLKPNSNNTYDLGTSSKRWRNVYTNDLNLSNEGSSNDVDGTWGDWTIQEGESDLFLKNNRSGKKYKFNLTEVS